jgi:DNA helicase HerA-like ATPase
MSDPILIAKGATDCLLLPAMANRHGLIAGATGTGKTVTLQTVAESFSRIGVPVFMADVKGDLSGIAQPGGTHPKLVERAAQLGIADYAGEACPTVFWDLFGEKGHPVRTTITEMGPLLLARLLGLNDTQAGVLNLVFRIADDAGWLLIDLKDLRAMAQHVGENAKDFTAEYGNVSAASIGAIQRNLLAIEEQGGDRLFGEPALDLHDLLQTDSAGRGAINLLAADRLMQSPRVYATFLLWLLSELFESMPEVGDREKPQLVLFFDEAHLLFDDLPDALREKIEQIVRLIRSKGVGVFFVTQNPRDVPDPILAQLGNRVQHALRAFTPAEQKALRLASQTFRQNPSIDTAKAITELGVGEALVSLLDEKGQPAVVERALVVPPRSQLGPIAEAARAASVAQSPVAGHYEKAFDRESAYERLRRSVEQQPLATAARQPAEAPRNAELDRALGRETAPARRPGRPPDSLFESVAKSAARSIGSSVGRQIVRGLLGSLMGGASRRRR